MLTGAQLDELHDEALWHAAEHTDLFVEVDPNQKERIILALKKTGHVVGFLGDGINDAPAMHAADTSLSVEGAVDVAREAADFVLLERDLDVIRRGIEEGRRTFANTLKYVMTTTSANLGNMISMAVASLFLPFLPLLAGQILLNNFLSDVPAVGLADDSVDPRAGRAAAALEHEASSGRFMIEFGCLSSLFDFLTFALLLVRVRGAGRAVPHRLVRRVAADRARDRAGRAHAAAVLAQPAGSPAAVEHGGGRAAGVRDPLPALRVAARLHAAAGRPGVRPRRRSRWSTSRARKSSRRASIAAGRTWRPAAPADRQPATAS